MEIAEFTMDGAGGAADPALGPGVGPGVLPGADRGLEPGLGEIAGRLLTLLDRQDKLFSASQVLSRMRQNHPGIGLSVRGSAIDEGALSERIAARLATLQRLPRIGSRVVGEPTVLSGWSVVAPRGRAHVGRSSEHVVLINASQNRIGLFMSGSSASEPMVKAWDRSFTQSAPVVLRYDAQTVDLVWESAPAHAAGQSIGMGPVIERIEASSGRTLWFSSGLSELLPVREDAPELARRGELVVAVDESVVVVADRVGRVAGLDAATGRTLWRRQTPVLAVADVACGAGVVAVGGLSGEIGAPRARPVVVVLDAKRGEIVQRMDDLVSPVRWVRMSGVESGAAALVGPGERAGSPAIIAGLNTAVVSFDPSTGRPNWSIAGSPAASALDAFVFGSRLFLLDGNRQLWLASVATGQTTPRPLQSMDHFLGTQLEATALPGGRTLFASERGVCVFDERGELAGIDGLDLAGDMTVVPALATGGGFLTIESGLRPGDTGYRLHLLDAASAKLVWTRSVVGLDVPPRRIAVIDGRLLVSAGGNVIVLAMPEGS
jgi:outer membrane protein assembly factor BamB